MANGYKEKIKSILLDKKSKTLLYVIGVLWIAVIMQVAVNVYLRPDGNLLEAFVNTNSYVSSYELEMVAEYGNQFLSEEDKKELLIFMGNKIGLEVKEEVIIQKNSGDNEAFVHKEGKNAETLLKVATIKSEDEKGISILKHYLIIRIKLFQGHDTILQYRDVISAMFKELKAANIETNMQLSSNYKGKLSLEQMNKITDGMITDLEGKVAYENREEELYTVYAYTGLLPEYVSSLGNKINIHVAIQYDEEADSTNVYLGTPIINKGY